MRLLTLFGLISQATSGRLLRFSARMGRPLPRTVRPRDAVRAVALNEVERVLRERLDAGIRDN